MKVASIRSLNLLLSWLRQPANFFLAVAAPVGLSFVFLTPPMQGPDEHHHFFRAYQISRGDMIPDIFNTAQDTGVGGDIPNSIKTAGYDLLGNLPSQPQNKAPREIINKYWRQPLKPAEHGIAHFEPGSSSSALPYLATATGMRLAARTHSTVLQVFYAGRLANFILWLAMAFLAIKLLPYGKWVYVVLLLMPVTVFQAASLSPDAATNGLSFLYVAAVLYLLKRPQKLNSAWTIGLVGLAGALALCKQAYFIIALFGIVLPLDKFRDRRQYWIFKIGTVGTALLATMAWAYFARKFLPYLDKLYQPGVHVSPHDQLISMASQPLLFPWAMAHSLFSGFSDYLLLEFNGRMGWSDVQLPVWLVVAQYLLLLTVILSSCRPKDLLSTTQRWVGITLAVAASLALAVVVYLSWTPVGDVYVRGLQGRYFIPIAALLAPLLIPVVAKWPLNNRQQRLIVVVSVPVVLVLALFWTARRYYL